MRVVLLLAFACGGKSEEPVVIETIGSASSTDVVKGTVAVDGVPATLGACKPGHSNRPFVELVTSAGKLRFEDQRLYWNPDPKAITRGDLQECTKLDRSFGAGTRLPGDGTSYWRGKLWFTCTAAGGGTAASGKITGELELDCGNITATERAQLDGNRQELLGKQRAGQAP